MKKVICIDNRTDQDSQLPVDVIVGMTYTVIDNKDGDYGHWYKLEEMSSFYWYSSDGFADLSDIDEKDFQREYKKELV